MLGQTLGYDIQRLVPGDLLELGCPITSHLGYFQPLAVIDEVHSELALEAALALIRGAVPVRDGPYQPVPLVDFDGHLAAYGAVRTYARDLLDRLVPLVVTLDQRASGADVDARATELAARLEEGRPIGGAYQGPPGALQQCYRAIATNLSTHPDAPHTGDAQVHVHLPVRVVDLEGQVSVVVGQWGIHFHLKIPHRILQLALLIFRARNAAIVDGYVPQTDVRRPAQLDAMAGQAAVGMLRQQQFHDPTPHVLKLRGLGLDPHPIGHRRCA